MRTPAKARVLLAALCLTAAGAAAGEDCRAVVAEMTANAPDPGDKGIEVRLPGTLAGEIVPARHGTCLAMKVRRRKDILLFNVAQARFEKPIRLLEDDSFFAAGGDRLAIYMPVLNVLEVWDLRTRTKLRVISPRLPGPFAGLWMGMDNPRRALLACRDPFQLRLCFLATVDLDTFETLTRSQLLPEYLIESGGIRAQPDRLLTCAAVWAESVFRGRYWVDLSGPPTHRAEMAEVAGGRLSLSAASGLVLSTQGMACDRQGRRVRWFPGFHLHAVVGAPGVLQVKGGRTLILRDGNLNPVWRRQGPCDLGGYYRSGIYQLQTYPAVWPMARAGRIVLLDNTYTDPRLFVLRLDLPTPGDPLHDPPPPTPGRMWSAKLPVAEGDSVTIEDAPAGMQFEKTTGRLIWFVPKYLPEDRDPLVLVSIRKPGQEEFYWHLRLGAEPTPAVPPAPMVPTTGASTSNSPALNQADLPR